MIRSIVLFFVHLFNGLSTALSKAVKSEYQLFISLSTYAPWLKDKEFLAIYAKVKKDSLVSIHQCWELWKLVDDTKKIEGDIIEIGTYKGSSAAVMGTRMKLNNSADKLFCCDTFKGIVKASKDDNFFKGGELGDVSLDKINKLFHDELKIDNVSFLVGIFPEDTGHEVENNKFRLCHIDVDVYLSAKDIIDWVWDKLSIGGIIVFQDYGFPRTAGITKLLNEQRDRDDCVVVHNLNGNGLMIKCK